MPLANVANILKDKDTYCSCLLVLLVDAIGPEALSWDPESLRAELLQRYAIPVTPLLSDKINAASGLVLNNLFHKDLGSFIAVSTALDRRPVSSDSLSLLNPYDLAWAVSEAKLIQGASVFESETFDPDIAKYVGEVLAWHGITKPPAFLSFAAISPSELDSRDLALATDPILNNTYEESQKATKFALERYVADEMTKLLQQLTILPLKDVDSEFKQRTLDLIKEITNVTYN